MTAQILDGAALAGQIRAECAGRVRQATSTERPPCLAVILVGDSQASAVYVRHKVSDCEEVGIRSILHRLDGQTSQAQLLTLIAQINTDPAIDGLLVQLPLPGQIDEALVIATIDPAKDVDGFHVANAGALLTGQAGFWPCTPYGVMKLLEHAKVPVAGKHAVVIGRSNIVGKPQALMLLRADATVTICHSKTQNLATHLEQADIIVAAIGRARFVTADMIKPGAVIVDVGMNRDAAGKLCGDVDFDGVSTVASWVTPVPGGVGPMTRAMLLVNTLKAARRQQSQTGSG